MNAFSLPQAAAKLFVSMSFSGPLKLFASPAGKPILAIVAISSWMA